jgi:hypothetical protein
LILKEVQNSATSGVGTHLIEFFLENHIVPVVLYPVNGYKKRWVFELFPGQQNTLKSQGIQQVSA